MMMLLMMIITKYPDDYKKSPEYNSNQRLGGTNKNKPQ